MSVISTFAFAAAGRAAVEAFDDAAVAYGAEVLHAPKEWPEYHAGYGAFVRDPDGSNIEDVPPLRKVLAGRETSWYFPSRKVLSRRASWLTRYGRRRPHAHSPRSASGRSRSSGWPSFPTGTGGPSRS
jgi:hypothetical protein